MRLQRISSIGCAIVLASAPLFAFAQTITVQVGPAGGCAPMTGTGTVNIATTCGNVTISNSGGTARVRAVSDGTTDHLVLENAQVTSTAAVTNFPITYWAPLSVAPNAPPARWYYAEGSGNFSGTPPPNGDSITFRGHLKPNTPAGNYDQVGSNDYFEVTCDTCVSFSPALGFTTYENYASLTDPRDAKGEITFTLNKSSDRLRLISIKVRVGPSPDAVAHVEEVCIDARCPKCIPRSETGFLCRLFSIGCDQCVKDDSECPPGQ